MKGKSSMHTKTILKITTFTALAGLWSSCSSNSTGASSGSGTTTYNASKPAGVISAVGAAVSTAGSQLSTNGSSSLKVKNRLSHEDIHPMLVSGDCDSNGDPTNGVDQSNARYPGVLTYCKMTVNSGSPDTIQGGFQLVKNIACALENVDMPFDGSTQTVTLTIDTTCFTANQVSDMGGSMTINLTTSAPASFNSYYEKGIIIDATGAGMLFKIGSKVSSNKIEFITSEYQGATKTGMTAGSLDLVSGELRYETMMDRIDCNESGSCGWNRHMRLYADMTLVDGSPADLESISFGYADIQKTTPGGTIVSASGDLTTGIKARLWQATNGTSHTPAGSVSDLAVVSNWEETTNSKCYTDSSEVGTGCGAGLDLFTVNTKFAMTGGHTSPISFFGSIAGQTFTSVSLDEETP